MQVIKMKVKTDNAMDLIIKIIKAYCLFSNIKIGKTEAIIMGYLVKYGIRRSTREMILRSQILKSQSSIENTITQLRRIGLLTKRDEGEISIVIPQLSFTPENRMGMIIQFDNL